MSKEIPTMKKMITLVILASAFGTTNTTTVKSLQIIPKIQANVVNSYDETTISSDEFENNFTAKGNATFQSSNEAILTNDIAS
ncbi:hypothetical protein [Periweissella beninensis]|uniref:hypothetical protein n=1 Tax=Periweissella beninensis TaxID=504936 RepID=UPI0021A74CAB|nr:hypothetical protein [Periweissella beninensis]MCT4396803.1 hypothetical protein [Periweissella beninensis]